MSIYHKYEFIDVDPHTNWSEEVDLLADQGYRVCEIIPQFEYWDGGERNLTSPKIIMEVQSLKPPTI